MEGHSLVDCSPAAPAAQTLDNYLRAFRMLPACGCICARRLYVDTCAV